MIDDNEEKKVVKKPKPSPPPPPAEVNVKRIWLGQVIEGMILVSVGDKYRLIESKECPNTRTFKMKKSDWDKLKKPYRFKFNDELNVALWVSGAISKESCIDNAIYDALSRCDVKMSTNDVKKGL